MSIDISRLAFTLCAASQRFSQPLKNGHAQQLLAAVLGYHSLAAFQASPEESSSVTDVRHLLLDIKGLQRRVNELELPYSSDELMADIKRAFALRMPTVHVYSSEDDLVDRVRHVVDDFLLDKASGELSTTNNIGLDEIYLPVDFSLAELPLPDKTAEFLIDGHISVQPDLERPYCGHRIEINAILKLQRVTRNGIAEPDVQARRIGLDWSWGDDDHLQRPMTAVLAELLHIGIDEAEQLVDIEPQPIAGNDDETYGFVLDFESVASPTLKAKILTAKSTLQVRVGAEFFDLVKREPYD